MFDEEIKKYRLKHKRCRWCKYYKYKNFIHYTDVCLTECLLKDNLIKTDLQAIFCKHYKLKGDNDEVSIIKSNKS